MLQAVHKNRIASSPSSPSGGKVVIVSNFTSMLDHISLLLTHRGWGGQQPQQKQKQHQRQEVLRLDGSVSCELRQGLVERFNRASDASWVFLLAAKGEASLSVSVASVALSGSTHVFMSCHTIFIVSIFHICVLLCL